MSEHKLYPSYPYLRSFLSMGNRADAITERVSSSSGRSWSVRLRLWHIEEREGMRGENGRMENG